MRRVLGFVMVVGLLVGGASACSSSSDNKKDDTTTTVKDNGGSSSGNAKVVAYCKAVDEFVKKAQAAKSDPSKASTLATEGQDLSAKAQALGTAGLSSADAAKVADCTKKSTAALTGG